MKTKFRIERKLEYKKPYIQEGIYHARLLHFKEMPKSVFGERIAVIFKVYTENGISELPMVCSTYISETSRLGKLLIAMGKKIEPDTEIDINDLVGGYCQVMVIGYTRDNGQRASAVNEVYPENQHTREFIAQIEAKFQELCSS